MNSSVPVTFVSWPNGTIISFRNVLWQIFVNYKDVHDFPGLIDKKD